MKKLMIVCIFYLLSVDGYACFPPPLWPPGSNTLGIVVGTGNNNGGHVLSMCNLSSDSSVRLMGVKMCEQYCKQKYRDSDPGKKAVCGAFDGTCYCLEQQNFPTGNDPVIFPDTTSSMCNDSQNTSSRLRGNELCTTLCSSIHRDFFGSCVSRGICECNDVRGRHSLRINKNRYIISIK